MLSAHVFVCECTCVCVVCECVLDRVYVCVGECVRVYGGGGGGRGGGCEFLCVWMVLLSISL